jgi:hypothetical protein
MTRRWAPFRRLQTRNSRRRWLAGSVAALALVGLGGVVGLRVVIELRPDPPPPFHLPDRSPYEEPVRQDSPT